MTMKTIVANRVDLWDGGERQVFGFYLAPEVAKADIQKAHPHCHISPVVLTVFDSLDEVKENDRLALRKRAWLKLSPQEREAFGMLEEPK